MTTLTSSFDIADYLESDEDIQAFLLEAIQNGMDSPNPGIMCHIEGELIN